MTCAVGLHDNLADDGQAPYSRLGQVKDEKTQLRLLRPRLRFSRCLSSAGWNAKRVITREALTGNIPSFLRDLTPVTFSGKVSNGQQI